MWGGVGRGRGGERTIGARKRTEGREGEMGRQGREEREGEKKGGERGRKTEQAVGENKLKRSKQAFLNILNILVDKTM